jgi:exoribonuclease R
MHEAGALFRGAGYTPLDGAELPPVTTHAAVAAPYAHVTAPLRRLVDRFGLVISHAVRSGGQIPDWARQALPALPAAMASSDALAGKLERACLDVVEAAVLAHRVGETFDAVVVDVTRTGGKVQLIEPAVLAGAAGPLELGERVRVRLTEADPQAGSVRFEKLG